MLLRVVSVGFERARDIPNMGCNMDQHKIQHVMCWIGYNNTWTF